MPVVALWLGLGTSAPVVLSLWRLPLQACSATCSSLAARSSRNTAFSRGLSTFEGTLGVGTHSLAAAATTVTTGLFLACRLRRGVRGACTAAAVVGAGARAGAQEDWLWQRRGYRDAMPGAPGYESFVAEEGRDKLVPPQHGQVVAVPKLGREIVEVPVVEAGTRGPRFRLLPPPVDDRPCPGRGVAQLGFISRLDTGADLRLRGTGCAVPSASGLDPKSMVCHVPEPYCRRLRPGQRERSAAMALRHEPHYRALEREGRWLAADSGRALAPWVQDDDKDARHRCFTRDYPVSGSRAKLNSRIKVMFSSFNRMSLMELSELCGNLGIPAKATKAEMIKDLNEIVMSFDMRTKLFEDLSLDDLRLECSYRGVISTGTREQLLAKLMAFRSAPKGGW